MKTIKLLLSVILSLFTAHSLWAQITIMPLGDSITYDNRINETRPVGQRTAYRQRLYLDLKSAGYDVDFVGSQVSGQEAVPSFDPDNEGHPGWHADGYPGGNNIAPNIYNWLFDHPADVVLLHIGTNDISIGQEPAGVASEIGLILDEIDRYKADKGVKVKVILARIINRVDSMAAATTVLNNQIQLIADERIVGGDDIIVVDMEYDAGLIYSIDKSAPYDGGDMYDQFHPNVSGYEKMAVKWFVDGLLAILPQADAGADLTVNEKTLVTLDGSWSVDPDEPAGNPLSFWWKQELGTEVLISNPTAQKPTFTAPEVGASGDRLGFQLTVTDADGFEHSDTVFVDIENVFAQPVADAGTDQTATAGDMVTLNGSSSWDPDGTILAVQWMQISGNTQVTLTSPQELATNFVAPDVDSDGDVEVFKLTVKDNDDLISEDTVSVTITPPATISPTSVSSGGGGSGGGGCFIHSAIN